MNKSPEINQESEPPTITLRDKKWHYISEGNANIILAIPADGMVLRIMKNNNSNNKTTPAEMCEILSKRLDFCNAVRWLFFADHGLDYVDVPILKSFMPEELHEIDDCLQHHRPASRRHKGLDWTGGLVTLYPDYTTLPGIVSDRGSVFCAEIKPKQGWSHMADRMVEPVTECAFCAHQHLKMYHSYVERISLYCPLDLFSGDRERVVRAVVHLLQTPQNNLKMYLDGVQLGKKDADSQMRSLFNSGDCHVRFAQFIAAALLGDWDQEEKDVASDCFILTQSEKPPCNFDAVPMPNHCVLHKILTMQKMQTASFTAVCLAYEQLPERTKQFSHVDRLRMYSTTGDDSVILSLVDRYLVAATARDCSIFVTFCQTIDDHADGHRIIRFGNHRYAVCVKVSDLDPKPLSTIDKHRKRNANVLLACQRYLQELSQPHVSEI